MIRSETHLIGNPMESKGSFEGSISQTVYVGHPHVLKNMHLSSITYDPSLVIKNKIAFQNGESELLILYSLRVDLLRYFFIKSPTHKDSRLVKSLHNVWAKVATFNYSIDRSPRPPWTVVLATLSQAIGVQTRLGLVDPFHMHLISPCPLIFDHIWTVVTHYRIWPYSKNGLLTTKSAYKVIYYKNES